MIEDLATKSLNYPLSAEQKAIIKQTKTWSKSFFNLAHTEGRVVMGGHGFDHNKRVSGMAARLCVLEGFEKGLFPAVVTALVFDIGRTSSDPRAQNIQHGQLSREMSDDFLNNLQAFSHLQLDRIGNAIEDHPKLNPDVRRVEGYPLVEVLMDADRLDTIGALTPVRAASTRWRLPLYTDQTGDQFHDHEIQSVFQDIAVRISRWFDSIWTDSARIIAQPRQEFLMKYIEQFDSEVKPMMADYHSLGL